MNHLYTTLGEGRKTAVLFNLGDGTQRRVSSTDAGTAAAIAGCLDRAYRCMPNALWPAAVESAGEPVSARRRLLARFDALAGSREHGTTAQTMREPSPAWSDALDLVDRLAACLTGQPAPVIGGVRHELAHAILPGLDGVLVAGALQAQGRRPGYLRLVLNQILEPWRSGADTFDPFFTGMDEGCLTQPAPAYAPRVGLELALHLSDDGPMVLELLRDLDSCHPGDYAEQDAESLFDASEPEAPDLFVAPAHLRAWIRHHRPDLTEQFPTLLG